MTNDLFSIKNKNVIITGGTGGIGKDIVKSLVSDGAKVFVVASNKEKLEQLKRDIPSIEIYQCDLANEEEVIKFCNCYKEKESTLDILINNAGISKGTNVENIDSEDFYDVFKVNLFAPYLLIKNLLSIMKNKRKGVILNIASVLGTRAVPGIAAYTSSKSALIHFSKCLSLEVAPFNIRVNCISPGYIKTELNREFFETEEGKKFINAKIPLKRLLEPEELLPLIKLVISDAGSYMTGTNIIVDGGLGNW